MEKVKDIKEDLIPKHLLEEDTESIKTAITESENENEQLDNPKLKEVYAFNFSWKDPRGKLWEGHFINKILTIKDRQNMGIMRSRLSGGVPSNSLDDLTAEINLIVSHLSFSLVEKPDWASDLRSLDSIELLQALYEEVYLHEATFRGLI